jgi:ABC-type multidrug transport system fused ATPase/permease subunit
LENLRSRVSAIPQEPVLFSGTVGQNLDPFDTVDKGQLREALRLCHLDEPLEKLRAAKSTAEAPITDLLEITVGDSDLSVGQKQLLCLARAVSRNLRILVLDEATSSVDAHTDQLIQETIRTVFKSCTVITVAHRLNTIMDSDRVLVLDGGRVAEFDAPSVLLERPDSMFANLAQEAAMHEEGDD